MLLEDLATIQEVITTIIIMEHLEDLATILEIIIMERLEDQVTAVEKEVLNLNGGPQVPITNVTTIMEVV